MHRMITAFAAWVFACAVWAGESAPHEPAALLERAEAVITRHDGDPLRAQDEWKEIDALRARIAELRSHNGPQDVDADAAFSGETLERIAGELDRIATVPVARTRMAKALGTITGTVTDASTGNPVAATVRAFEFSLNALPTGAGVIATATSSAADGSYSLTLPPGNYSVRIVTPGLPAAYVQQIYNQLPCRSVGVECPNYFGTIVPLPDGGSASGIDFALVQGGSISGTLTSAATGDPVPAGTTVIARSEDGVFFQSRLITTSDGSYSFSGLPADTYVITPSPTASSGLYGVPGPPVTVGHGQSVGGIDLALPPGATISGTVTSAATGSPVASSPPSALIVTTLSEDRMVQASAPTNASGAYSLGPLPPGRYRVMVQHSNFLRTINPGRPCKIIALCGAVAESDWIVIGSPGANVAGVDFSLAAGASLQVTVRNAQTLAGINGARITANSFPVGFHNLSLTANASGVTQAGGLFDETYQLFVSANGFTTRFFPVSVAAATSPLVLTVDLSPVSSSATLTGISGVVYDAVLNVPMPANTTSIFASSGTTGLSGGNSQRFNPATGRVEYTLNVAPGAYKVHFSSSSSVLNHVPAALGGELCSQLRCTFALSPNVVVADGAITPDVDWTLTRGASLRARLLDAATGTPAAFRGLLQGDPNSLGAINVVTFTPSAGFVLAGPGSSGQRTDSAGYTLFRGVVPGTHYLRSRNFFDYIEEQYDGQACPNFTCTSPPGTPIIVGSSDVSGLEIALEKGGAVAGRVVASAGNVPLTYAVVFAYNAAGQAMARTTTDDTGAYRLPRLPPGTYYLATQNPYGLLDELHPGLTCEPLCNPTAGSPIVVTGTETVGGIDFALDAGATIAGTVSRSGTPMAGVTVELYGGTGAFLASTSSTVDGSYAFTGLAAGTFHLRTRNTASLLDELYAGLPCVGSACIATNGTVLNVAAGATVGGVNLAVSDPAAIAGTVRRASNGSTVGGAAIQLLTPSGQLVLSTSTAANGTYRFDGLAAGDYHLVTRDVVDLVDLAWPASPCAASCNGLNGSAVTLTAGATTAGIDFALPAGGAIEGDVTGPGGFLAGVQLQITGATGSPVGTATSDAAGHYRFAKLVDGDYRVRTANGAALVDEVYSNKPCSGTCDMPNGDPLVISAGSTLTGIDFALAPGGGIAGNIQGPSGGVPDADVAAYDVAGVEAGRATTDGNGDYAIDGLVPGPYRLRSFNVSGLVDQVHAGRGCTPAPCPVLEGEAIAVAGTVVGGIDFALAQGSVVGGTATDEFNNPLATGSAELLDSSGAMILATPIQFGTWEFDGVADGSYYVLIRNTAGLIDQLYDGVDCPGGACDIVGEGTPVVVPGPAAAARGKTTSVVRALEVRLPPGRRIAGRVSDAANSQGLAGAKLFVFDGSGTEAGSAIGDGLGSYRLESGLPQGNYFVATANGGQRGAPGYVNGLYLGSICLLACDVVSGTPVPLAASDAAGIDLALDPIDAAIAGTISRVAGGPASLVEVRVHDSAGRLAGTARSDSLGGYRVDGLVQGTYYAVTRNALGLQDRRFGGSACTPRCDPLAGTPISVATGGTTQGVDIQVGSGDVRATTTLVIDASVSVVSSVVGASYAVPVVVEGGVNPSGTIAVSDGTHQCEIVLPATSCALASTSAGTKTITATYDGDAANLGSSASASHEVSRASPTLAIVGDSPDPSIVGVPFDVVVQVSGGYSPAGPVVVSDGTASCTIALPDSQCALTPTSPGTKTLTASYGGDSNNNGTSATATHVVSKATPELAIVSHQPNPSAVNQPFTVVTSLTGGYGTPTGTIAIALGTDGCTITLPSDRCSMAATRASGSKTLRATYSGDANNKSKVATATHDVTR